MEDKPGKGPSVYAIITTCIAVATIVWALSTTVYNYRWSSIEDRVSDMEITTGNFLEFRGETKTDLNYLRNRMDEILSVLRTLRGDEI